MTVYHNDIHVVMLMKMMMTDQHCDFDLVCVDCCSLLVPSTHCSTIRYKEFVIGLLRCRQTSYAMVTLRRLTISNRHRNLHRCAIMQNTAIVCTYE